MKETIEGLSSSEATEMLSKLENEDLPGDAFYWSQVKERVAQQKVEKWFRPLIEEFYKNHKEAIDKVSKESTKQNDRKPFHSLAITNLSEVRNENKMADDDEEVKDDQEDDTMLTE